MVERAFICAASIGRGLGLYEIDIAGLDRESRSGGLAAGCVKNNLPCRGIGPQLETDHGIGPGRIVAHLPAPDSDIGRPLGRAKIIPPNSDKNAVVILPSGIGPRGQV